MLAAWIVGTLLVASLAGWLVARTSGQRLPGQAITGGLPGDEVALKLAEARQLLGVDPQQAIIRYQQVRELDPDNAEALTYMGWLIAQSDASAAPAGAEFLRGAIKLDPTYADPHCFLAITSADLLEPPDIDTARVEAQACLDNNPPSQMIGMIQGFIDRLGPRGDDADALRAADRPRCRHPAVDYRDAMSMPPPPPPPSDPFPQPPGIRSLSSLRLPAVSRLAHRCR